MHLSEQSLPTRLFEVYRRLREHFTYARRWWPGTAPQVVFSAILVQQSNWTAVWAAVKEMRNKSLLSPAKLASAKPALVRRCIHGVTFSATKSARLMAIARRLCEQGFETVEEYLDSWPRADLLRADLLTWKGVGNETADCIVSFAAGRRAFIIDNYTRRIFRRLMLFPELDARMWDAPYEEVQEFFETQISAELKLYDGFELSDRVLRETALYRDFHAQLVELGCHHCLKNKPRCNERGRIGWRDYGFCRVHCASNGCVRCPLFEICATGRNERR